jgi:hypothetical protein
MQMKNALLRLRALERLPQFQPPPSRLHEIEDLALRQVSDEDLAVMVIMATHQEAGKDRPITERESEVLATHNAVREKEAQRMGFTSFAEAERRGT